ncbi:MAG TPA: hypothetical protein VGX28_12505 [Frankiaceae bacterium]|nr:hypothetical protein [Frankiaceae bacterium]
MKRTLSLRRESLAELSQDQLAGVNGAAVSLPNVLCAVIEPSGQYQCTWQPTRCLCP